MEKVYFNFNDSLVTLANPNQTGETLPRDYRKGTINSLCRNLTLLFAVLVMSVANIGTAWGTEYSSTPLVSIDFSSNLPTVSGVTYNGASQSSGAISWDGNFSAGTRDVQITFTNTGGSVKLVLGHKTSGSSMSISYILDSGSTQSITLTKTETSDETIITASAGSHTIKLGPGGSSTRSVITSIAIYDEDAGGGGGGDCYSDLAYSGGASMPTGWTIVSASNPTPQINDNTIAMQKGNSYAYSSGAPTRGMYFDADQNATISITSHCTNGRAFCLVEKNGGSYSIIQTWDGDETLTASIVSGRRYYLTSKAGSADAAKCNITAMSFSGCASSCTARTFKSGEKIYFKDQESNFDFDALWKVESGNVYAYFWNDTENAWSSNGTLAEGSWDAANTIYELTVPGSGKEYTHVLFTRGSSNTCFDCSSTWDKTTNQEPCEGKNLFYVEKGKYADHIYYGHWGNFTPAGKTVYFDNRNVTDWTTAYVRIGHGSYSSAWGPMTKVAGTRNLYSQTTSKWASHTDFAIANKAGWTEDNHIDQPEKTYTNGSWSGSADKMTKQTNYQQYAIENDVYLCPKATSVLEHECQFYQVTNANSTTSSRIDENTTAMELPSYTVTTSSAEHCTVTLQKCTNYGSDTYTDLSSGGTVLPTQYIKVTVTPSTGYQFGTVTVTGVGTITAAAAGTPGVYYVTDDATITATCTAKTCTVTFDKEGGSSGSDNATATYGNAMPNITAPTKTGYTFGGYWDGDNGTGTQYYKANGTSNRNWDKDVTATQTLYAKWTVNNYDLTWNLGGGTTTSAGTGIASGVSENTTSSVAYGTSLTAPTVTKANYTFSAWSPAVALTMPAANTTYTATFTANQYSVTHSLTNMSTTSGATGANAATYGTDYSAVLAADGGYTLPATITVTAGATDITANCTWNSSTGAVSIPGSYITGNITITAAGVAAVTYTVTYDYKGATGGNETLSNNGNPLPNPSKTGYSFAGWYASDGTFAGAGGATSYVPTADITLYAQWQSTTCAGGGGGSTTLIDWTPSGLTKATKSGSATPSGGTVNYSVEDPESSGNITTGTDGKTYYKFGSSGYFTLTLTPPAAFQAGDVVHIKVTATSETTVGFKLKDKDSPTQTITGSVTTANTPIELSTTITTSDLNAGALKVMRYGSSDKFGQVWVTRAGGGGGGTCYYVTYNGNGADGGYTTDETSHASGSNVTVKTNSFTKTGYTFTGWKTEPSGGTSYAAGGTITGISGNMTLYAQWTATHSVSAVTSTGADTYGTVSAAATTVAEGATTTITAVPATGYQVTNWAVSGAGASISPSGASNANSTTLTMGTADATVTATFGAKTYTITLDKNGGTTDGSATATYNATSLSGITHATNTGGYTLVEYHEPGGIKVLNADGTYAGENITDGSSYQYISGGKWVADEDKTLKAYWKCNAPTISFNSATNTVTISGCPTGATIRYTTNGTDPNSTTGTVYSGPFTIAEDCTVKAIAYKDGCADSDVTSETCTYSGSGDEEPTVTWTGVPATVYPGQQFVFTVETNTDASLAVGNLTATNASLENKSIAGGVFTATAQIAADATVAPTFTLSTATGTTYAAKVDTKSGITLGSCESSSGTATLFAFTCTSTAINTYSATGGTATLSGSAMSDKITIDKIDYYKFNSSSQWTMALTSGTFAIGDVITFTMACNTGSDKEGKGVKLNNSITVTRDYAKNTAQTSTYTVVADDGIAGQNSFTIKRNDSDIKFGTVTVTRAGQSLDNKQETTIEWPETVDGVRVVEYDALNPYIPSLAIISSIGEATYTSNNEDVGSFRNGNVELIGGYGNVTITVSVAAVGCMEAAESSYVLTVTPKRYTVEKGTITGTGCDISISETSVPSGDIVTLTPVPATGYSLTEWDVHKKGDSSTKVTVTNNRFTMPDYDVVVNATFTAKSTVATLSALSVTNADTEEAVTLSPTFASGTTAYTATLSCGTTSAPRISATKTDSKATTRLTNVSDLSGDAAARTATIVVTAEDGVTTQTYTIVFTVSAEGCVRLAPSITSISEGEDICSGGSAELSVTAESRNNDGGTLSYQWQKHNGASWDNITGATEADYTTDAITAETQFRCVVTDTKDASEVSTNSDEITIGVTSIATPTYTQGANVVTLSCATAGATIWYSTDGNDPAADADNSRQGTSVSITRSGVTVKAIAYLEGCRSAVMTLTNADYSSGAVDGSIIWSMNNAGNKEAPKFNVTCVPNTVLSAATAFTMQNDADYDMSTKSGMSVKISGITSYSADGKHVSLNVTVADGYTFTPCSLSVRYQPVSKDAKYKAKIGSNTSSESSSVSAGETGTKIVNFSTPSAISGTEALHLYVYGTDLTRWRLAGDIILYGTVQTTGTTYYSVTYNRNDATSGTVPQDDNLYTSGQTVELAANTGNLAKTGYIFSGWSTTSSGEALTENPTITGDMTLYAVWTSDESLVTEVCANVSTDGTNTSIAVGGYNLYFSSSNSAYKEGSVKSSTANKCEGDYRYYMPGVVVALTNSNATTIKLKGQQDYNLTVSKVMVADALNGAWKEISFTPVAYTGTSCGVLGISGVQIAQGKYVFLGFTGGSKNEFRISGLCITPFIDPCPYISIAKDPVGDTWAKDATGVQISVGATTDAGVLSYQWQESTDNTNFSDIDAATGTTYDVPTGTVGTKYYRCVVSNGSCSKNSESAKIVIVEPTVTALYDYWYVKQGRQTPNIALFEVTKGTPASNVTIPAAEVGKYSFVYNTSDYKIYLQGSAPSAIYADEDVEVTASIKSNSNSDNITLHLLRATSHPQLAFVVTGTKGAGFESYEASQVTCDLYTQLASDYIIQATNVYSTTDEKAIRAYYSQFDIILNTDYPDTQKGPNGDKSQWNVGYVNALGAMVDIVPILTMEAYVSRLPNWKIKHDPKSPEDKQYSMLLNCRAHEIFGGIPDGHMSTEMVNGEEHKVVTIVDENDFGGENALQGFSADELSDMDVVGQIHNGDGQLMACVERQFETTARMMVLGINSAAMVKLTEDGIKVVKNALIYLQHKSAKDVNDCSLRFDNKAGDNQWKTVGNWAPGYSTLPTPENKVIILADCELDELAHVDMAKINEDVKLTIKPTGALIVDGTITRFSGEEWLAQDGTITSDNLAVEADASHTGALILSNPESKIGAEVQMYSASYWETVAGKKKKYWSYVGVPIADVEIPDYFYLGFTYLYDETSGWIKKWDGSVLQPFEGIGLSMQAGHRETFRGTLASTKTKEITLTKTAEGGDGENLIGNSWTAPIQIANFETADFGGATATVYIYNTGRDDVYQNPTVVTADADNDGAATAGQWVGVPIGVAGLSGYTGLKVIPAMNAFQVKTSSTATLTLDYDKLVRKNAASNDQINNPLRAPRRDAPNEVEALMRVRVSGEKTHTDVWLLQDERFSDGFDNGWEATYAECDNRSAQLYAVSELGQMAFIAKPDLEGTPIGFAPSRDGNLYTFSFQYTGGDTYYLNDLKEEKSTLIEAENTYLFTYEAGEMSPRFLISTTPFESPSVTTGVGNVGHSEKAQKIIYNDHVYIIRGGKIYDVMGKVMK